MPWTGGAQNRTWKRGRADVNRNVPGDAERGPYLFALLREQTFCAERCGATHQLGEMRNRHDYSYANRR